MAFFKDSEHAAKLNEDGFRRLVDSFTIPQINPNAGIPQQYTQQAQQPGLMNGDALAPMRMYQNRNSYQSQYGTPESLAPMQMLNQYRQGNLDTAQVGTTPGTSPAGGK